MFSYNLFVLKDFYPNLESIWHDKLLESIKIIEFCQTGNWCYLFSLIMIIIGIFESTDFSWDLFIGRETRNWMYNNNCISFIEIVLIIDILLWSCIYNEFRLRCGCFGNDYFLFFFVKNQSVLEIFTIYLNSLL